MGLKKEAGFQLTDYSSGLITIKTFSGVLGDDIDIYPNTACAVPHIRLYGDSLIRYYSKTTHDFYTGSTETHRLESEGGIHILERAAAPTAIATYGCLWVKNDDTLHYIDGAGNDHTIAFV